MITPIEWTSRSWTFGRESGLFPAVLERLRGTPVRAEVLVRDTQSARFNLRTAGKWSAQEHIGHLADLDELDDRRLSEFLDRVDVLTAADMSNSRTEQADHNRLSIAAVLERLRSGRQALIERLDRLSVDDLQHTCLHPRLGQRMTIVDWMYFVAEHDDHHLAQARLAALTASPQR